MLVFYISHSNVYLPHLSFDTTLRATQDERIGGICECEVEGEKHHDT